MRHHASTPTAVRLIVLWFRRRLVHLATRATHLDRTAVLGRVGIRIPLRLALRLTRPRRQLWLGNTFFRSASTIESPTTTIYLFATNWITDCSLLCWTLSTRGLTPTPCNLLGTRRCR